MLDVTRKCPICGRPYKVYSMMAGDQSACADCRSEAERRERKPTDDELRRYAERRRQYFGG